MKKFVLYAHDGSGNHGCEALVRSTVALIDAGHDNTVLISARPEEDLQYGIDSLCRVIKKGSNQEVSKTNPAFWRAYWSLKMHKDYLPLDWLAETSFANVHRGDIAMSIGGDSYCYGFADQLGKTHAMWKYAGLKTVYWGCSIEPELLENESIAEDIRKFDLITARETISFEALRKVNPNTILVSDSAFHLKRKDLPLPDGFDDCDLVGINSSPLIEQNETIPGMARLNYQCLIESILQNTDMKILLVPHVVWAAVDDRQVLQSLYEKYADTGRVGLIQDCGCEELKGYIARCKYFVGARTHATIAAYSSCVPTLVVGYSVKAKGIARDLFGTEEHYVLPVQNLKDENDLSSEFAWLVSNGEHIRGKLSDTLPEYCARVNRGVDALKKL